MPAQRQLKLVLDDLADVRVTGGTQEAREEAEVLRARWQRQAEPVLRASRVATVEELDAAFQAADERRQQAAELEQEAKALRARADVLAGVDRDEELDVEDWQQALAEAESALESLAAEEESVVGQLATLGEEGVTGLGEAESRLEKATAAVAEGRARKEREQREQESVRQELDRVRQVAGPNSVGPPGGGSEVACADTADQAGEKNPKKVSGTRTGLRLSL